MHNKVKLAKLFSEFIDPAFVISDAETQRPYECDGLSMYCEMPLLVLLPESVLQIQKILKICHQHSIPVVTRGAGTGLCAGAMPDPDSILLSTAKLDEILEVDPASRTARVEPGVRNISVSEAVAEHGLYYAPDPSSQLACTIGGNVAENSGGAHCLKYGLTIHNVLKVNLLTVEGEFISIGSDGLDSAGFDLLALIIGSEGMLGIVTEITLKLLPIPEKAQVVMAAFDDVQNAGAAVSAIIAKGIIPAALEMMDSHAIIAAEQFAKAGYPVSAKALLLCELDGSDEEVIEHIDNVSTIFKEFSAFMIRVSKNESERALLWKGRKSAFPAVGRISPDYYCMDGTIPRRHLAHVLTEIEKLSQHYGLRVANVFHAGDGNLHPLILFDANVPGEFEKTEEFGGEILKLCVEVGGCITGEHGVGKEKIEFMQTQFNASEIAQFHAVKSAFDPLTLLNPGKGIPLLKNCQEYRSLSALSINPELPSSKGSI